MTALRAKQSVVKFGLKVATGTLTGVTAGTDKTATLPATPTFVLVRANTDTGLIASKSTAVLFDGNTQYLIGRSGSPAPEVSASLSGTTLTLACVDGFPDSITFNYVSFYIRR